MPTSPSFQELAAAAEENPHQTDFAALRRAYMESPQYQPTNHFSYGKLQGSTNACRDFEEVEIFCKKALRNNPMDLEVRMLLDFTYDQLEQYDLSSHHYTFISGMLEAIFMSGDGQSFETAWKLVAVAEEYTLLGIMGLTLQSQALAEHNGRFYDILVCTSNKNPDEAPVELYFDVTTPFLHLQHGNGE